MSSTEANDPCLEAQGIVEPAHRFLIVGLGASAGGLEAFELFFRNMPVGRGIAFVLVQHLDPHHKSMMRELLARYTSMPVLQVEDRTEIKPNSVYMIPPNSTMTLEGGLLRLRRPDEPRGHRAPIDVFFRSLAQAQGAWAVGIVLSGTGSDGTAGLRAIKDMGGMALAQEESSAKYGGMPRSALARGSVDEVAPVEELPRHLIEYAEHLEALHEIDFESLAAETSSNLSRIFSILDKKVGHDFSKYKKSTIIRRIHRRMQVRRVETIDQYLDTLISEPEEAKLLFRDLLIGVTRFFRDPEAFEYLEEEVIPRLFEGKGASDSVRVWVPGCATGEEAYSIAILLSEHLARTGARVKVQIFASDIDDQALAVARSGLYPLSIADHIEESRLRRSFRRTDEHYQIHKQLREMCVFSVHNLISDPPFSKLDLLSSRNLLIYLDNKLQERVLGIFHYSLRPGAFLFLGSSEGVSARGHLFNVVDKKHRIFRRGAEPMPRHEVPFDFSARPLRRLGPQSPQTTTRDGMTRQLERLLLSEYVPACVLVDESNEVIHFFGRTGRFLEPPPGAPSFDVVQMARRGLRMDLRGALHQARRDEREVVREGLILREGDDLLEIDLTVRAFDPGVEPSRGMWLVIFQVRETNRIEVVREGADVAEITEPVVKQLEDELRSTKEYLQATIEELETSNEELQSSNEELMSMNEELQSSNEELETSKEELQSLNEELETVNAELNQKIGELSEANSDLRNLFESTRIATVFLDRDLRVKRFTPAARNIFQLIDSDVGRPITDIVSRFPDQHLEPIVERVLETLAPYEEQIHTSDDRWYKVQILPYRTVDDRIDGAVATFVDITDSHRAQRQISQLNEELEVRIDELEAIFDLLPVGIAISEDADCSTVRVNQLGRMLYRTPDGEKIWKVGEDGMTLATARRDGEALESSDLPLQWVCAAGEPIHNQEIRVEVEPGVFSDFLVNAVPLFGEDGDIRGAVGGFLDITKQKADRRELSHRVRQQALVAELSLYALSVIEVSGLFDRCADRLAASLDVDLIEVFELRGDTLHRVAGAGWGDGDSEIDAVGTSLAAATLETREPILVGTFDADDRFEPRRLLLDQKVSSALSVVVPVHADGRSWGVLAAYARDADRFDASDAQFLQTIANVLAVAIDRTRAEAELRESQKQLTLRRAEASLRRAERLASLGTFAAGIAHQINNPVSSILMTADRGLMMLDRETRDFEVLRKDLEVIADEAERCGAIVHNVLTFAKESDERGAIDLNQVVERAAKLVRTRGRERSGFEVDFDLAEDLPRVYGQATDLEQVVGNLLQNASEAVSDDAEGEDSVVHATVRTRAIGDEVQLEISDDGRGISAEARPRVFDPFFTTRREVGGTGLGLSFVHHVIREHGGSVDVSSEVGEGTTFVILLPQAPDPDAGQET